MKAAGSTAKRLHFLDSARGLAALSVMTWHFFTAFLNYRQNAFINFSPFHLFWYGEADVVFFFIHSGFILTYSYMKDKPTLKPANYLRFLIERIFRIYPLFLFVLVLSFLLQHYVFTPAPGQFVSNHIQTFWRGNYSFRDLTNQAILIVRASDVDKLRLIPQDWTLAVELTVGFLIPFAAFLSKKLKYLYWPVIIIAIKLLHFDSYLFEFAVGIFLYYRWPRITEIWAGLNMFHKFALTGLAIACHSCFFYFGSLYNSDQVLFRPGVDRLFVIAGSALLFAIAISSSRLQKFLNHEIFVRLGRICYSLYLVHMLLLICWGENLMQWLHRLIQAPNIVYLLAGYLVYLGVTFLISSLTYSWIEKPFNRLGKKIGKWCQISLDNQAQHAVIYSNDLNQSTKILTT
jgi:peptidoglycan/LPS O-acetylase OafA/YrhL